MQANAGVAVVVAYAPRPRVVHEVALTVAPSCSVLQAIGQSALLADISAAECAQLEVGIWGRKVPSNTPVREGDRIEIYRPLTVDPKVARRERFVKQGAKAAGLFSARRAGAKAGY